MSVVDESSTNSKESDAQTCHSFRCSHHITRDIDEALDQNLASLETSAYIEAFAHMR